MSGNVHPESYTFDNSMEGVCQRVAVNLNDAAPGYEHERWTKPFIKATVRDSLAMMAELVPTAFQVVEKWDLASGSCIQQLPDGCDSLIEIICITDKRTGEQVSLSEIPDEQRARNSVYPDRCSTSCSEGGVTTPAFQYSLSASADKFGISPEPSESDRFEVEAMCSSSSSLMSNAKFCDPLPDTLGPWILPLTFLATGLLLMRNRDDAALIAQSQSYMSQFSLLSNIALARVLNVIEQAEA